MKFKLFFVVVASAFGVISKKLLRDSMSLSFYPVFSSKSFLILAHTFRPWIHFQFIFAYGVSEGCNFIFCMWISSFPITICWKDCPLPIEWSRHPCQKPFVHMCRFISGLFSALVYMFIFVSVPHCFEYCRLVVGWEIRKCETPSFFLFHNCFDQLESLEIPYGFQDGFFNFCKKCNWDFYRD